MRWRIAILLLLVTAISASALENRHVRVEVLGLFHSHEILVETLPSLPLLVDSGAQQFVVGGDARESLRVGLAGKEITVQKGDRKIIGERFTFSARQSVEGELVVVVPGKLRRHYRGQLIIQARGKELQMVVVMELETAVASVIAAELPSDSPWEALKAQAVVARSYLLKGHRHINAEFCDTTHCQFLREPPPAGSRATLAARATQGEVLTWKGQPFPAMYSASCGGHTHSLAHVGAATVDYPYFEVECAYCRHSPVKWSTQLNKTDATGLVPNNERERILSARKLGWDSVPSSDYTRSELNAETVVLTGVGRGHGIGLCQRGASGLAREGKDYRAILAHYFPNTTVESALAQAQERVIAHRCCTIGNDEMASQIWHRTVAFPAADYGGACRTHLAAACDGLRK